MNYERRKKEVQAIKLAAPIFDQEGKPLAEKGDWLVIENGQQYYMTDSEFNEEFQVKRSSGIGGWSDAINPGIYGPVKLPSPTIGDITWQVPKYMCV